MLFIFQLQSDNPVAFYFLGTILFNVNWPAVIQQYAQSQAINQVCDLHLAVLRIFVMLSVNKAFMSKTGSQLQTFSNTALGFSWQYLNAQNIDAVCGWFSENCEPVTVLNDETYSSTVLPLLRTACRFLPNMNITSPENCSEKRNSYAKMMVRIIARAAEKNVNYKSSNEVTSLLHDVEITCGGMRNELALLIGTVLALLNSIPEGSFLRSIEDQIQAYLSETNCEALLLCTLSAGSCVLASLDQLVVICERAIESFLSRQSDTDFNGAWTRILQVFVIPDLNQEDFVRKALAKHCLLTLYAVNLHRLSLCRTPAEEKAILTDTFRRCLETPPSPVSPEKSLIIWWQILTGIKQQIDKNYEHMQPLALAKYIRLFAHYCQQISEDKSYSGLLGAIGIGKKSMFSAQ